MPSHFLKTLGVCSKNDDPLVPGECLEGWISFTRCKPDHFLEKPGLIIQKGPIKQPVAYAFSRSFPPALKGRGNYHQICELT